MPGTILNAEDTAINKRDPNPCPVEITCECTEGQAKHQKNML